jgi:hypothetical protein
MTRGAQVVAGIAAVGLVVGLVLVVASRSSRPAGVGVESSSKPVDQELAAKAQEHCWFNVKSQLARTNANRDLGGLSSSGARTERLGDLLIVTGAMQPSVGDVRFYGCSLIQYTEGSPVVMATKTSANPLRAESVVPFGFTPEGKKQ